ncbi:MAG: inositol monophosphatase [Candidatus Doudnabacteria bacterium]|nr:inositol monophosphatase [Candidatus Doudnabacteria bacterium]
MDNQKYLKVAIQAAKQSGPIFKKFFGNAGRAKMKNGDPRNLVTKIDLRIERHIRKTILKSFPGAKIIGEEYGSSKLKTNDVVWLIDPIDGTNNYIRGVPFSCISIGVWDGKGPLSGVVYNPIINQIYTALRGQGAFLNGKRIHVSNISKLNSTSGAIGWLTPGQGKKTFNQLINAVRKLRVFASSSWQTCMVASGQLDYFTTRDVHIWDVGGPLAILQEAGGKFTDFKGNPLKISLLEIVASNGKLQNELINKLKSR